MAKRGTFLNDQNQMNLCRLRAERRFLKTRSLYNVGNSLYTESIAAYIYLL